MIFLTGLDQHAEPTPIGGTRIGRNIPTIAEACGFAADDYVPDAVDAPLGRFGHLLPDAPEVTASDHVGDIVWPAAWRAAKGAAAMAACFICDVLAPCDRLPGVTSPDGPAAPPLSRADVARRLGNLRDGRPRLDILFGGACLQGSRAMRRRQSLFDPEAPDRLLVGQYADLRLAALAETRAIHAALVALYNSLCDDPAVAVPRETTATLWRDCMRNDVVPLLCGERAGDGASYRAFVAPADEPRRPLPMEVILGPFSLFVPMLIAESDPVAAKAALQLQIRRGNRHNLPGYDPLLAHCGLAASADTGDGSLAAFLLAETRSAATPFGPLGGRLFSDTVLGLIEAEKGDPTPILSERSDRAFRELRNLASRTGKFAA